MSYNLQVSLTLTTAQCTRFTIAVHAHSIMEASPSFLNVNGGSHAERLRRADSPMGKTV